MCKCCLPVVGDKNYLLLFPWAQTMVWSSTLGELKSELGEERTHQLGRFWGLRCLQYLRRGQTTICQEQYNCSWPCFWRAGWLWRCCTMFSSPNSLQFLVGISGLGTDKLLGLEKNKPLSHRHGVTWEGCSCRQLPWLFTQRTKRASDLPPFCSPALVAQSQPVSGL